MQVCTYRRANSTDASEKGIIRKMCFPRFFVFPFFRDAKIFGRDATTELLETKAFETPGTGDDTNRVDFSSSHHLSADSRMVSDLSHSDARRSNVDELARPSPRPGTIIGARRSTTSAATTKTRAT